MSQPNVPPYLPAPLDDLASANAKLKRDNAELLAELETFRAGRNAVTVRGGLLSGSWATLRDGWSSAINFASDNVDLWRRVLGTAGFVCIVIAARGVFGWLQSLTGTDVTLPRAIIGASIAGFFVAAFRLIDRLTMRETLLMKIEEARLASKADAASDAVLGSVKALSEAVGNLLPSEAEKK